MRILTGRRVIEQIGSLNNEGCIQSVLCHECLKPGNTDLNLFFGVACMGASACSRLRDSTDLRKHSSLWGSSEAGWKACPTKSSTTFRSSTAYSKTLVHFWGSMTTFMDRPAPATSENPSAVFARGSRWVIMSSTFILREAINSMAAVMSRGLPAYEEVMVTSLRHNSLNGMSTVAPGSEGAKKQDCAAPIHRPDTLLQGRHCARTRYYQLRKPTVIVLLDQLRQIVTRWQHHVRPKFQCRLLLDSLMSTAMMRLAPRGAPTEYA